MDNRPGSSCNQIRQGIVKHGFEGWFATLTPQKKVDYLQMQRIAREEKMAANHISLTTVANSLRTPLSNITNTQTSGTNSRFNSVSNNRLCLMP